MNRASRGVVRGESSGRPLASGASLQRLVLDNYSGKNRLKMLKWRFLEEAGLSRISLIF